MNKSVSIEENQSAVEVSSKESVKGKKGQSTLQQLGRIIRQSIWYFVLATIVLAGAYAVIINRQNVLQETTEQLVLTDDVQTQVLLMGQYQRDFSLKPSESAVLNFDKYYQQAIKTVDKVAESSAVTEKERQSILSIKRNIQKYNELFNRAVAYYRQRGWISAGESQTGLNKQARQAALSLNADLEKVSKGNKVLEAALLKARGTAKDFVLFENPIYIPKYNEEMAQFIRLLTEDAGLNPTLQQSMINSANDYQKYINAYAKVTLDAKGAFKDATLASHASRYPIPRFAKSLKVRQQALSEQIIYILIATAVILIAIFLLVGWQLRKARIQSEITLQESIDSAEAARAENEQLNDSVINILETVFALSQRDLTVKAPVSEDVIGTVSDSINALTDETAKVLTGVTDIAGHVALVSGNVSEQAEKVSQTSEEERQSVQQMIESLFEATQTMNQVAALAEQSNESAEQATTVTDQALETVTDTVSDMESIRETISETEKRIKRLGDRSQEISGIVNLINTISERTHALALNASMQAAVAGEAGRGFAVVAEEVQRLAESSRNATEQIATLVNNIQLETNETINTVNHTISQVIEGSEQAQKAGQQMQQTKAITAELVERVRNIASASEKQKEMSGDLLAAVQRIGDSTETTAKQIAEQSQGTQALQQAASYLLESVSVFKLPKRSEEKVEENS